MAVYQAYQGWGSFVLFCLVWFGRTWSSWRRVFGTRMQIDFRHRPKSAMLFQLHSIKWECCFASCFTQFVIRIILAWYPSSDGI
jgi:hypothetical protein